MVVFGLGGIGLNVIQAARMVGANMIVGVDINPARRAMAEKFGMTHFVNPKEVERRSRPASRRTDQGRRRLQFRVHRQHPRPCARRWNAATRAGACRSSSAWRRRVRKSPRARSSWSPDGCGRVSAFGGARGRTDVPKIVDWYMDGKLNIDDLITHVVPLDRINETFDLMHAGKSIRSVVTF